MQRSASKTPISSPSRAVPDGAPGERGVAVLIALLLATLIGAIAAGLIALTTTETLIGASFRHGYEAAYGAEAGAERALRDLAAIPDWSNALRAPPGGTTSGFNDGRSLPIGPDGRTLDLVRLTADRQRDSDAHDGPTVFGADSPQWRLFAHAPADALLPAAGFNMPLYLVVWVADDESDADGDPSADSNRCILVWATAFGSAGARRSVEARIAKTDGGDLQVLGWK